MDLKKCCLAGAIAAGLLAGSAGTAQAGRDLHDVDWRNARVPLPATDHCPGGTVKFINGDARAAGYVYRILADGQTPVFGDTNGDGRSDALLPVMCGPDNSEFSDNLVSVGVSPNGNRLQAVGTVVSASDFTEQILGYSIADELITVQTEADADSDPTTPPVNDVRYFRWAASAKAFVEV